MATLLTSPVLLLQKSHIGGGARRLPAAAVGCRGRKTKTLLLVLPSCRTAVVVVSAPRAAVQEPTRRKARASWARCCYGPLL